MVKDGQVMKAAQTHSFPCTFLLRAVVLSTAGCLSGIKESYSLEERIPVIENSLSRTVRYADGSALDLYVVEDEDSFDENYVALEATAFFDASDKETLYSKEAFERLYPASITKAMTALVAIKNGNLNTRVVVTGDAVVAESGVTLCGIEPGDILTLEQLLCGLMFPSDNDVDATIAVHIAGSIDKFADVMNQEAASLGAIGTHFVNPHGLNDPDHYITAYGLYLIFSEVLKYPVFRQIVGTTSHTTNYRNKDNQTVTKTQKGGNQFMAGERETPEGLTVFEGKTGITNAAGYCLIMAIRNQNDKKYISVVLEPDSRPGLYGNMTSIIFKIAKQ